MGLSDYKPGRRLLDWPDDVVEFADRMGIGRFAVVGGSGGVPATLACAYKIPHRLSSVAVLCGPRPLGEPGATDGWSRTRRIQSLLGRRGPLWIPELAMRRVARVALGDPDTALHRIFGDLPAPDRAALERPELNRHYVDTIREAFRSGPRGAALEYVLIKRPWGFRLEDIPITVHLWHGEDDTLFPPAMGRYLARAIPDCRATFFPNEGHFSLLSGHVDEVLTVLVTDHRVPDLPSSADDPTRRSPARAQSRS
jgi:pimeloyl-ACP methyl ester carboxylesterase